VGRLQAPLSISTAVICLYFFWVLFFVVFAFLTLHETSELHISFQLSVHFDAGNERKKRTAFATVQFFFWSVTDKGLTQYFTRRRTTTEKTSRETLWHRRSFRSSTNDTSPELFDVSSTLN